ncbi:MAG: sugar phosphate nucleotidyltransferase [Candidatus Latescibacterota bacterium]|nr:sugar phosphate nucleotidyltransferase [Candidatus Latescibacterota bacterium]
MDKAVILARGLGTRMRATNEGAELDKDQAAVAKTGVKALMPIGRPFLDYLLGALAGAGYRKICLVIGPEHEMLRRYCDNELNCDRINIEWTIQEKPLGTANAVVAAEAFADGDDFIVVNSDNYYPIIALEGLRSMNGPGVAAYSRESMIEHGNIETDRLLKFAVVEADIQGMLNRIIEKPTEQQLNQLTGELGVGMNSWRFDSKIFEACRSIPLSARGEFELPDAVQFAMEQMGISFNMRVYNEAVLDLSHKGDVESVKKRLENVEVNL